MPSSRQAMQVTDTYRARVTMLRQRGELLAATAWRDISPVDLDGSYGRWVGLTALRLTELQRAGATLSAAYLAAFVGLETGQRISPTGSSAVTADVGMSRTGKPLREALITPLFTVKKAIGAGADANVAMRLGMDRAVRNSSEEVAYVARAALDGGIRDHDQIVGWRRVTGGGCGACLAAATGAIQADDEVLPVHDHCQCSKEPVVRGVKDQILRPTGEEMFRSMTSAAQDALFMGKGGADKAALVRSGDVPFHALIAHDSMAVLPDGITEAPLEALQHHT